MSMAIEDPAARVRLRRKLEELVGVEEADLLMDRPPGGWSALVTKEHLDLRLATLESRFDAKLDTLRADIERGFRDQAWRMLGAFVAFAAVLGGVFTAAV